MKVALITGGNKGIVYEICRNLVQAGNFVLLAARNETLRLQAVERLKQEGAETVSFIEIDTTKQETVTAAAKQIAANSADSTFLSIMLASMWRATVLQVAPTFP